MAVKLPAYPFPPAPRSPPADDATPRRPPLRCIVSTLESSFAELPLHATFSCRLQQTNRPGACLYQCLTIFPTFLLSGASPRAEPCASHNARPAPDVRLKHLIARRVCVPQVLSPRVGVRLRTFETLLSCVRTNSETVCFTG